ncbi:MAG TPA: hypothetical protein VGC41_20405 [Kofleriaceae bacterium]
MHCACYARYVVTGQPSTSVEPRVVLVDGGDVFETIEVGESIIVRSAFLFEIGEELKLRVDGREVMARVRGHRPDGTTELTLLEPSL